MLRRQIITGFVVTLAFATVLRAASEFDVRDYGGVGDAKTKDTAAIQKAIDACAAAGGGVVRFKPGTYVTTPLFLKSNVTLVIEAGATVKGTGVVADHPIPDEGFQKEEGRPMALINAIDQRNIAIIGPGTIDGSGQAWWEIARAQRAAGEERSRRPFSINFIRCKDIVLDGFTSINPPQFHIVTDFCENVIAKGLTILAPDEAPNTDGIDPRATVNMIISECYIDTGDDDVAIKSGFVDADNPGAACRDIIIRNCHIVHGHGISIGSETNGGVKNVLVENCTMDGTENGIRIKSPRGRGGNVENITFRNIWIKNARPMPITITAYYPKIPAEDTIEPVTPETPKFKNILIENVYASGTKKAGVIIGVPESMIENVTLRNVELSAPVGLEIRNATGVKLENVRVKVEGGEPLIVKNAQIEGELKDASGAGKE